MVFLIVTFWARASENQLKVIKNGKNQDSSGNVPGRLDSGCFSPPLTLSSNQKSFFGLSEQKQKDINDQFLLGLHQRKNAETDSFDDGQVFNALGSNIFLAVYNCSNNSNK